MYRNRGRTPALLRIFVKNSRRRCRDFSIVDGHLTRATLTGAWPGAPARGLGSMTPRCAGAGAGAGAGASIPPGLQDVGGIAEAQAFEMFFHAFVVTLAQVPAKLRRERLEAIHRRQPLLPKQADEFGQ